MEPFLGSPFLVQRPDLHHTPPSRRLPVPGESLLNARDHFEGILSDLMLPNSNEAPAFFRQREGLATIAIDVLSELAVPERGIAARMDVVLGAPVPEAAVDEEGELQRRNDEVSLASGRSHLKAVAKA